MTKSPSRFTRPGWLLLAAFSPLLVPSPAAHAQIVCEEECLATYSACSQSCLDAGASVYGCEETCQNNLDSCLYTCPPCPTSRTYDQRILLSTRLDTVFQDCFYTQPNGTVPRRLEHYTATYRLKVFRETTQCNGTKTTVLLSDYTYQEGCWKEPVFPRACSGSQSPQAYVWSLPRCPF